MYIALTIQHNYDKKRNVVLSNNDECCVDNDATGRNHISNELTVRYTDCIERQLIFRSATLT